MEGLTAPVQTHQLKPEQPVSVPLPRLGFSEAPETYTLEHPTTMGNSHKVFSFKERHKTTQTSCLHEKAQRRDCRPVGLRGIFTPFLLPACSHHMGITHRLVEKQLQQRKEGGGGAPEQGVEPGDRGSRPPLGSPHK